MSRLSCIAHKRRVLVTTDVILHRSDGSHCDTKEVRGFAMGTEDNEPRIVSRSNAHIIAENSKAL